MHHISIILESIGFYYTKKNPLLNNISSTFNSGETTAIVGANGSGKSTLLKIILDLIKPKSGNISYLLDNEKSDYSKIKSQIGFVAPYLNLYEDLTILEHFEFLNQFGQFKSSNSNLIELIDLFALSGKKERRIKTYSSGEKQKAKLILAVSTSPRLLILDEPSSNLDSGSIETLFKYLKIIQNNSVGIIIATNEEYEKEFCQNVIKL